MFACLCSVSLIILPAGNVPLPARFCVSGKPFRTQSLVRHQKGRPQMVYTSLGRLDSQVERSLFPWCYLKIRPIHSGERAAKPNSEMTMWADPSLEVPNLFYTTGWQWSRAGRRDVVGDSACLRSKQARAEPPPLGAG